ncbi:MAG: hypothetical protein ACYCYM_12020 [Saccharofermentanales bacterium]
MTRYSSINALFWGFFLVFIDINILSFDVLNDVFGLILIIFGLRKLSGLSGNFVKGFNFALIHLAWQIFRTILNLSTVAKQNDILIATTVVGFIVNLLMTYFVIKGLAELASRQDLNDLSNRLKTGFVIYLLSMVLGVASIFIMQIAIVFWITAIILFIYLLKQIRSAYNTIADIDEEEQGTPSKTKNRTAVALLLSVILPIALGIGLIGITETNIVEVQPFVKWDYPDDQIVILSIRSKMVDLGFQPNVVDSMPDSEILYYENIVSVQSCQSEVFNCGGGKLMVSQYVSSYDFQNYRYTVYYEWIKKPVLAHAEALGIVLNDSIEIEHLKQTAFSSLNLFDIQDGTGEIQSYTSADITISQNVLHTAKKFNLPSKKGAQNFRGYIASNIQVSENRPWAYNNMFYYIHQNTIFNNRGTDLINFNENKTSFSYETKDVFFDEYNVMALINIGE